ncbi:hypothetical protein DM860_005277 [Cuscuta australis]|uniref:DYW domain-containing protein n=1 Tax=Cuscuta australis TaxID=267555 RepID=A0A328E3C0_9ASTE|nr:hypothetical protein DM860_005277 [Cuscuta australis]
MNPGPRCFFGHPNPEISVFFQKGFSEIIDCITGRAVHAICIKESHFDIFHSNTLIRMYSKFGRVECARYVFDQMPQRNEASWNNIISGYVLTCRYYDAVRLFIEMWGLGIEVNEYTFASVLTALSRSESMCLEGYQVHGLLLKYGFLCNIFVGTSLLHFYGAYGLTSDARIFFEEMPEKNVVSWTSMMVTCSNNGNSEEAISLFKRLRCGGIVCNQNTFTAVISSCSSLEAVFVGLQVLGHVVKSGFEDNVSVGNALISMFGNFNFVEEASRVFEGMTERDTISWNSMISVQAHNLLCEEAFRCFYSMRREHNDIDSTTLSSMLSACGSLEYINQGRGMHGLVIKLGFNSNMCVSNTLLSMYADSFRCSDAENIFHNMPDKDLISWNSMMAAYVLVGNYFQALKLLTEMLRMGMSVSYVTFASALAACSDAEHLSEGNILHGLILTSGLHEDLIVGNALVTMYGKHGMMVDAEKVFINMPKKELVTWNALIGGYASHYETDGVVRTFKLMRESSEPSNYITIINALGSCSSSFDLVNTGMPLHGHIILTGFEADEYVRNSLIAMYAECGDLKSSNFIFNDAFYKSFVTWNVMVSANAHHGHWEEALKLFRNMQRAKVELDQFSLSSALSAAANLGSLEEGQLLHCLATKLGFDSYHYIINATMDMYGKCGELEYVLKMLPEPNTRSRLSWNIMMSTFSRHGLFREAREAFHEMLKYGQKPDNVTFVSLLSACSHGGLVDEGLAHFASMTTDFGVPVAIEHCVCIVDMLGRSGRLAEAEAFIKEMVVPPNDFVWRSLLAACRMHGHAELAKKATDYLLASNPMDDSAHVLYSNVCATSGKWQDVQNVRAKMELSNIKKQPSCSWVKMRDKIYTFGIGDGTHSLSEQIYDKLGELRIKLKEAGYVPDTSFALHDTDEEQKEQNLWRHSEKLALAYALITTAEGSKLRIFKNLRVCGDCHSVYKLVSNIVRREIVLKDPYRFHHFSGGKCSCGDYW